METKKVEKNELNDKRKEILPTELTFEDLYPNTYLYTPPESLKTLEVFFNKRKKKS